MWFYHGQRDQWFRRLRAVCFYRILLLLHLPYAYFILNLILLQTEKGIVALTLSVLYLASINSVKYQFSWPGLCRFWPQFARQWFWALLRSAKAPCNSWPYLEKSSAAWLHIPKARPGAPAPK